MILRSSLEPLPSHQQMARGRRKETRVPRWQFEHPPQPCIRKYRLVPVACAVGIFDAMFRNTWFLALVASACMIWIRG